MIKKIKIDTMITFTMALAACSLIIIAYGFKLVTDAPSFKTDRVLHIESAPIEKVETVHETEFVTIEVPPRPETELSDADKELIAKVVHAESGNQDAIGRRLVADVILNRVDSLQFPNTVAEVIDQEGQFTRSEKYTDDDLEAVELECKARLDHEVLYFRTGTYHATGDELYQHGDHYFSGR